MVINPNILKTTLNVNGLNHWVEDRDCQGGSEKKPSTYYLE